MSKIIPLCCLVSMCLLFFMCFVVYKVNEEFNSRFMKQFNHNIDLSHQVMQNHYTIQNQSLYIESLRKRLGEIP